MVLEYLQNWTMFGVNVAVHIPAPSGNRSMRIDGHLGSSPYGYLPTKEVIAMFDDQRICLIYEASWGWEMFVGKSPGEILLDLDFGSSPQVS